MTTPSFFSGASGRQLLGVYDPPTGPQARDAGVVLCYPGEQEYMPSHWTFRKLAAQLARAGLHVLRFDYSCTGDSAGADGGGSVSHWVEDVRAAAQELRDVSGVSRVSAVGLRLGAALAVLASATGESFQDLVLWEPVVRGTTYLAQLEQAEEQHRLDARYAPPPEDELLLGYALPEALRTEVGAIDLLQVRPRTGRALLVLRGWSDESRALRAHLEAGGGRVEARALEGEAQAPERAIQEIASALTGGPA